MVDLRQTKLSQYKTGEQLLTSLSVIQNGLGVCECTLENIRLFGFELGQRVSKSAVKNHITINKP